jgi:hypothetical protein
MVEAMIGIPKSTTGTITNTHRDRCGSRGRGKLAKKASQTTGANRAGDRGETDRNRKHSGQMAKRSCPSRAWIPFRNGSDCEQQGGKTSAELLGTTETDKDR